MTDETKMTDPATGLTAEAAKIEVRSLTDAIEKANDAYHRQDAPEISDAEYDRLKRRLLALEAAFPELASDQSPTQKVGGALAEGFGKITHEVRMLSLGNAFEDEDVSEFDGRIRSYLGLDSARRWLIRRSLKLTGCRSRCATNREG